MLKSHERFHSANGKRLILVVDDELINRELLRGVLERDYELIFAENGQDALNLMHEHKNALSLVLLDLSMPIMSGTEVLKRVKADPDISQIPIIVITADQDAEVESLTLGAIDFIPKPYPQARVILARILRTIELSEDRDIINSTERDELTGLYNREYFYRYAEQYDQHHQGSEMDALVVDVNHFHMINERFGTAYGDKVLRSISEALRGEMSDVGGIVCRREADIFLLYCPHGKDHLSIVENTTARLAADGDMPARIWLRMGVYENVDKTLDIERRFDRAKMAADKVSGSFTSVIGYYDNELHERELFQEQLIEDFDAAIKEHQFQVHYQPKFDIQSDIPVLASAEALVRWSHPVFGMISPGVFIPLFEENGLVQSLDLYVWRETAAQIKKWRERFDFVVPVSVNVSRIDMYDPDLVGTIMGVLEEFGLNPSDFLLEITESAYTQDSEQIIRTVNTLRGLGFSVEMDDFGTGYSSLNMISTLPIDALKMDMQFIRNAFSGDGDTKMLEVVIDIAEYLGIPVIAEGVETQDQIIALKAMGCDFVQGYYFSKPVPADEYERFVVERMKMAENVTLASEMALKQLGSKGRHSFGNITHALSSGFDSIYYVDIDNGHFVRFGSHGSRDDLQIEHSGVDFFGDELERVFAPVVDGDKARVFSFMGKEALSAQLAKVPSFLMTYQAVIGGIPTLCTLKAARAQTFDDHHVVVGVTNVDDQSVDTSHSGHQRIDSLTYARIVQALASDYFNIYYVDMNSERFIECSGSGTQTALGIGSAGSDFFEMTRASIVNIVYPEDVGMVLDSFTKERILEVLKHDRTFTLTYRLMLDDRPTYVHLKAMSMAEGSNDHIVIGISDVDEQIRRERDYARAMRMANRDALTGVKSKYAYEEEERAIDQAINKGAQGPFAVAVCDINGLKKVNDTYGHNAGDKYIKDACRFICNVFKHSPVFRIGGDEFVAVLQGGDYEIRDQLMGKIETGTCETYEGGAVSIAGGLAEFLPRVDGDFNAVFERADAAMYENKRLCKNV